MLTGVGSQRNFEGCVWSYEFITERPLPLLSRTGTVKRQEWTLGARTTTVVSRERTRAWMEAVTGGHTAVDRCRACLEGMAMGGRCCSFPHQGDQGLRVGI